MLNDLEQAIVTTLRYFDVFNLPLTSTQLWRSLIIDPTGQQPAKHSYTLREVQETLTSSAFLTELVSTHWGYYYLRGREQIVDDQLWRYGHVQAKWQLLQRIAKYLALVPFVRMLAVSGSLALSTAGPHSDFDIFVITDRRRLWTARILLLGMAQLLGRRRQHWDREAPDKVCLNHYITDAHLLMPAAVQNLYTAQHYTWSVPLTGLDVYEQWQEQNKLWLRRFVNDPDVPTLAPTQYVQLPALVSWLRHQIELLLLEPLGQWLEKRAENWQRRTIAKHTDPGRAGRVVVSAHELAFHPGSKASSVLEQF